MASKLPGKGGGGVVVEGAGLHTGSWARVTLGARPGPVTLSAGGIDARIDELSVVGTDGATTVEAAGGGLRVATVEHLLAALAGLAVRGGVALRVEGPELPLLDGGAARWCELLLDLGAVAGPPRLHVTRDAVVRVGASRYEFGVTERIEVSVHFETDDPRVACEAHWLGDRDDFRTRIAPARTFAFSADAEAMAGRGLARGVDPAAVILLAPGAIHCVAPYSPDEPARHKLLDLVGDCYLYGGPPLGRLRARRPGHRSNTEALRRAIAAGVLAPS